jgi:hypothetical protein
VDVATYRTRRPLPRYSIGERLIDAAIGGVIGVVLGVVGAAVTIWLRFH